MAAVVVADDLDQLVLGQAGVHVDLYAASLKICTAAGERLSWKSERGEPRLLPKRGNVERRPRPRTEEALSGRRPQARLKSAATVANVPSRARACSASTIRGLDRGAAPDAQAGRGVAVAADVQGRAFLLQQAAGQLLGEVGLGVVRQAGDARIDDLRGRPRCWSGCPASSARNSTQGVLATQAASTREVGGRRGAAARPGRRCRRPTAGRRGSLRRASMEGVLIVAPSKMSPADRCRPLVMRNSLGIGQAGV